MRNKNLEMQELNDAAELLAQVEGATLQTSLISPADMEPIDFYDPIRPIIRPPFQLVYGIWIPPTDWIRF